MARAGPGAVFGGFFLAVLFGSQGFVGCGILMMAVIGVAGAAMLGGMLCMAEATRPVGLFLVWSAVAAGATFFGGLAIIAAVSGQPL